MPSNASMNIFLRQKCTRVQDASNNAEVFDQALQAVNELSSLSRHDVFGLQINN